MKNLVLGVGINDRSRPVFVNGKAVKEYNLWYIYDWCHKQTGFGNIDEKGRSWCLDKDLLFIGNKTYSETACVFVPHKINSFFTDSGNARGEYPVGVGFHKASGKFAAQCWVNGKRQHLGLYNTPEEAFTVYKPFKEALCKQLALKWQSEIDQRLFNAMMNWSV